MSRLQGNVFCFFRKLSEHVQNHSSAAWDRSSQCLEKMPGAPGRAWKGVDSAAHLTGSLSGGVPVSGVPLRRGPSQMAGFNEAEIGRPAES